MLLEIFRQPMTTTREPQDDDTSESDDSVPDVITLDSLSANPGLLSAENPESPTKRHSDKSVAVVTGAARRVGREIALAMAARGLAVVVHHGTSTVEANVLVNRIRNEGGTAVAVSADLRDPRAAAMTVFDAAAELGAVTTLINRAAVFQNLARCRGLICITATSIFLSICWLHFLLIHSATWRSAAAATSSIFLIGAGAASRRRSRCLYGNEGGLVERHQITRTAACTFDSGQRNRARRDSAAGRSNELARATCDYIHSA